MQWRYNLAHLILADVIVLVLTPLMVCVDVQARIAFVSERERNPEIYVMDDNGKNQQRLTNSQNDVNPAWYIPALAIALAGKILTMWGRLKQVH